MFNQSWVSILNEYVCLIRKSSSKDVEFSCKLVIQKKKQRVEMVRKKINK